MWLLGDDIWMMIYNYKNWNRESDHILLTNYANLRKKESACNNESEWLWEEQPANRNLQFKITIPYLPINLAYD